ncbi:hypothetical protein C2S52_011730 [Perilla frutescens var. hirtella]|nr:hypothetical protein C2S52_011730 [Perilla frutescens var. hirtella]KAH6785639.1 hypothetical protein C2S51_038094 [Perilla frutescens var. frutescens]
MSELAKDVKFSLKVMTNKQKTKVLFAEADRNFAEIILSFLMLPLGEIVRLMKKQYGDEEPVFGSLSTLYTGLSNLDDVHFWTDGGKKMLLNPRNSFFNQPIKYFRCANIDCKKKSSSPNVSIYYDSGICDCGKPLSRAMCEIEPKSQATDEGIFVGGLHFIVTDDLQMAPYEPGSMIQTFIDFGIVVTEGAELRNVTLGYKEAMDLLKGSLLSKTPLTDTILRVGNNTDCVPEDFHLLDVPSSTNSKSMTVTALIQRSTNKLLYVKAKEDFVDFILGFLTIPLGGVESLLKGKTSLKSIDNLFNTTANLIKDKHLMTKHTKEMLLEPQLPPFYVSKNMIFALSEQITPPIYHCVSITDTNRTVDKGFWMCYKDPKGDEGCYVKQPGMFMVSDNLTVIPLSVCSRDFIHDELKIPSSDVKEMEVQIGLKEGLSILKASLTSTSALTDGLMNLILKTQPNQ